MKKAIALFLALFLLLSGCTPSIGKTAANDDASDPDTGDNSAGLVIDEALFFDEDVLVENPEPVDSKSAPRELVFTGLNDPGLLDYYEQSVYAEVGEKLGTAYLIRNVSTAYISKEYIEELEYNSRSNVFFGYSLSDLDAQFQGTRYVFTLDENGETTVAPFEEYDDSYEKALKNVAIGTGVILVCVTVSAVSGGAGAPAVAMIFAASAKSGTVFAVSSGTLSAVITGVAIGMQTGSFEEAIKAGALAGSESFKWSAITGSIMGGASELVMLKSAAKGGLSLNEAAAIIKESNLPSNFVKQIHSMDEYHELLQIAESNGMTIQTLSDICQKTQYPLEVVKWMKSVGEDSIYFEKAGLYAQTINGRVALIRSIDLSYRSEVAGKTVTNLERMRMGLAAVDPATGKAYQLHHIGQSVESPFAILTQAEHTGEGNYAILHNVNIADGKGVHSLLSDSEWIAQKSEFWKALAEFLAE